jgi:hypothetical protein
MKTFLLACLLATAPGIVAEKSKAQNNIEVPKPPVIPPPDVNIEVPKPPAPVSPDVNNVPQSNKASVCADVNAPLLDIIKELTDQDSVNNEVKYEQAHKLTADKIYQRRMSIIKTGVKAIRFHTTEDK